MEYSPKESMLYFTDPTSHEEFGVMANIGDQIIKDAIVDNVIPSDTIQHWIPLDATRVPPGQTSQLVVGGANVIANNPFANKSVWRPHLFDYKNIADVCLLGVGWWQYQSKPNILTKLFYQHFLAKAPVFHSVRDSYSEDMLRACGIDNVINTGCPTMWKLPAKMDFPNGKAPQVVFTLTDYAQNPGMDKWLVEFLIREYQQVTFFPQGTGDTQYLESLGIDGADNIKHLKPSLDDYNHLLETEAIDYVGVRLHGGIRALQYGRRAIVIAVDNRAECISQDTGLPIVPREQIPSKLEQMVNQTFSIELKIDREKIDRFLSAFNQHYAASLHLVA